MNKRQIKALKQLSSILPDSYAQVKHTEGAPLWEFYRWKDEGHVFSGLPELTAENRDVIHYITAPAYMKINHYKRMKKEYEKYGTAGIQNYIKWVKDYNDSFAKMQSGMKVDPVNEGLMEIAKMKVSSFWKALMMFLFSFASIFSNQKQD